MQLNLPKAIVAGKDADYYNAVNLQSPSMENPFSRLLGNWRGGWDSNPCDPGGSTALKADALGHSATAAN